MKLMDDEKKHFEPVYLSSGFLLGAAVAVTIGSVMLNALMLDAFASIVLVSAADLFAVLSAFLAGNMYRLADMRSRMGLQARLSGESQREVLARLPPLRVVRFRFKVATAGFSIAALMLVTSFLTVPFEADELRPLAAVAVLGIAASAVAFLCGLWSRPVD